MRASSELSVRSVLLRLPTDDGRQWLQFERPEDSIVAWTYDQVVPALEAVDAATRAGKWAVGMVSYDAAPAFDSALATLRHDHVPLVAFGIFADAGSLSRGPAGGKFHTGKWIGDKEQADYESDVEHIRSLIAAGETYQVNYTMRLRSTFDGDPLGLFEALSRAQRADHLCFLDLGDAAVCSASPELFFTRSGTTLASRPMKGTRPRHPDPVKDQQLADDLVASEKDRAENTMIVDMTRNDLGRIAKIGSLQVPVLHAVETYPTVHQLTSTVTAESDASLAETFSALFPGASITGAPKVSTSHIIASLEDSARGPYCGAIGAVGPDGFAEFNIAIRTAWIDRVAGIAEYGTGGGIVWDSDPTGEWNEAHHKARVLLRACSQLQLLETIKYEPETGPTLLDRHLARLAEGAEHFGFDVDVAEARRLLLAVQLDEPSQLRLLASGNGGLTLEVAALAEPVTQEWALPLDTVPIDERNELLYFKTTARSRYDQARARFPDAPDVVLWNSKGQATETTIGNLVVELDGSWYTPPVSCGLLPGTFRAELLAQGTATERVVTIDELRMSSRIWMINSVRGWVPATLAAERIEA